MWEHQIFVTSSENYGGAGHRVKTATEFADIGVGCFDVPGGHGVRPLDYSENDRNVKSEIKVKSRSL